MSYIVLARKYRPQKFQDLVGQEHVSDLLSKAIQANCIAHSYLFCGPRGVGKTSCARILAKSLNCVKGSTLEPCGECTACKEITAGTSFDVLEIDGASNRGIDEIRTLRENVKFAPSYGQFKIYIVDEVHMLTTEAFNALLKTLEEPPPHVKFIFATTAPQKVPTTIISRCQRFDFKRIPAKIIVEQLGNIGKIENLRIENDALYAIAKAAQGSLRDSLSILDQLSVLRDRDIKTDDVFSMLGAVETELLFQVTDAISQKDCEKALEIFAEILDKGKDIKQLTKDLMEHFRNLMVIRIGGRNLGRLVDYPVSIKEMLLTQSKQFSLKEILDAIDTLIATQDTARITESAQMPLEMALAKLTYQGEFDREPSLADVSTEKIQPADLLKSQRGSIPLHKASEEKKISEPAAEARGDYHEESFVTSKEKMDFGKIKRNWDSLTFAVSRAKMSIATCLQDGGPVSFEDNLLVIGFPKECSFQKETLEEENNRRLVEKIFQEKLQVLIRIQFQLMDSQQVQDEEPFVKEVLEAFQGKVVSRWHNE